MTGIVVALKFWILWGLIFIKRIFMIGGFFGLMSYPISADWTALLVRASVGLTLLSWGLKKISSLKEFRGGKEPPDIFKFWVFSAKEGFLLSMCTETGTAICLLLGFCTRLAVIPCIINMAVAFKVTKGPFLTSPASLYLLLLVALFFIGAGQYSLDHLLMLYFGG